MRKAKAWVLNVTDKGTGRRHEWSRPFLSPAAAREAAADHAPPGFDLQWDEISGGELQIADSPGNGLCPPLQFAIAAAPLDLGGTDEADSEILLAAAEIMKRRFGAILTEHERAAAEAMARRILAGDVPNRPAEVTS